jgi:hypothetical protein
MFWARSSESKTVDSGEQTTSIDLERLSEPKSTSKVTVPMSRDNSTEFEGAAESQPALQSKTSERIERNLKKVIDHQSKFESRRQYDSCFNKAKAAKKTAGLNVPAASGRPAF